MNEIASMAVMIKAREFRSMKTPLRSAGCPQAYFGLALLGASLSALPLAAQTSDAPVSVDEVGAAETAGGAQASCFNAAAASSCPETVGKVQEAPAPGIPGGLDRLKRLKRQAAAEGEIRVEEAPAPGIPGGMKGLLRLKQEAEQPADGPAPD